jgi:Tfp pilus assembly protein PilN
MKTKFNLATAPLENNRRFIAGSGVLGVVALAAMLVLALHAVQARRANREMRTEIDRSQQQIRNGLRQQESLRNAFKSPDKVEALKRAQFLNGLIEARTFPWTKMFADLEQVLPPGVRVTSITPQMDKEGHVKIGLTVSAVNDEQALKFLNSLDASPVFSQVHVTQENHLQKDNQGSMDRVQVNLEAHYSVS